MRVKFTKGPWRFEPNADNMRLCDNVAGSIISAEEWHIARVWNDGGSPEEIQFNAHVLAAAPELYAALECFVDNWSHEDGASYPHYEDVTKAIEALKKARGES